MSRADVVVAEARRWVGTPFRDNARVMGVGVDCARLVVAAFAGTGVVEDFDPGFHPADWYLHGDAELYVETIERFADEIDAAGALAPADIVAWRFGRPFSHGAIVSAWPHVIHAFAWYGIVDETDVRGTVLMTLKSGAPRPMRAFRVRGL